MIWENFFLMTKKKTNKALKPIYDENGRWVEERGRIKGAIRRAFRLSPQMRETLEAVRKEIIVYKKNGTPAKKPGVRYQCAICKKWFMKTQVQIDHIEPVISLYSSEESMTYDDLVRSIFCDISNLQVVCSIPMKKNNNLPSCHKLKTDRENYIRKRFKQENGFNSMTGNPMFITSRINRYTKEYVKYLTEKEQKKKVKEERRRLRGLKKKK